MIDPRSSGDRRARATRFRLFLQLVCVGGAIAACTPRAPIEPVGRPAPTAASLPALYDSAHAVLFSKALAPTLLHQCSRPTPVDVIGYWTPAGAQLAALESGLPRVLAGDLPGAAPRNIPRPTTGEYYRQYAGIVHRDGRRTVYVNGFSAQVVADRTRFLDDNRDHPERLAHVPPEFRGPWWWRGVAVVICDGGSLAFGVEFDPATSTFSGLAFNGHR